MLITQITAIEAVVLNEPPRSRRRTAAQQCIRPKVDDVLTTLNAHLLHQLSFVSIGP